MVAWWWIPVAFVVGGAIMMVAMSLATMSRQSAWDFEMLKNKED